MRASVPELPRQPDPFPSTPYNDAFDGNGFFNNIAGTVKVRGFELAGVADLGNGFSLSASYTNSTTKDPSGAQRPNVPKSYAKFGGAYDGGNWGVNASVLAVGEVNTTSIAGGIGVVNYGDYVVADLAAHIFLDAEQKHKITARVQNLFDEKYYTAYGRSAPVAAELDPSVRLRNPRCAANASRHLQLRLLGTRTAVSGWVGLPETALNAR